jgi:chloride channel 2
MKLAISKKKNRLPGATLEKPHKNDEKLLADYYDSEYTEPKSEGWFAKSVRKRWNQLAHFLFEDTLLCCLLGVIVASISFTVDISYEYLHYMRRNVFELAAKTDVLLGCAFWILFMTTLVALAAVTCKYLSREAVGSGIPNIRVIMDGFVLSNFFSLRTLLAKIVGLILTLGSGIPIGKEGPFIHMGAIVAMALSKAVPKIRGASIISRQGRDIQNILVGCAVGIACTFNAPIGGVLYAIECTSRFSAIRNLWRSFVATTCAALIFRYANVYMVPENIGDTILSYYETHLPNEVFVVAEIPLFILLGVLCGLFGAAFIYLYRKIYLFRKNNRIYRKIFGSSYDISFTIFMTFIVAIITYPDGFGQYIGGKWTLRELLSDFISNCTMSGFTQSFSQSQCSDDIIYRWTTDATTYNHFYALSGFLVVNFFLVLICIGFAVPASMFVPTFVIGACCGRIAGEFIYVLFPSGLGNIPIYPGLYAIVGAAAFSGAVTHSISIAIICCEATGQLSSLIPILIGLMTATTISGFLEPSIYDVIVRLKKYPNLGELPANRSIVHEIFVENFMQTNINFVTLQTSYMELRKLLMATPDQKAYPLVTNKDDRILLGSVGRRYLHYLLVHRVGHDSLHHVAKPVPEYLKKRHSTTNLQAVKLTDRSLSGNTLLSTSPLHQNFGEAQSPLAPLLRRQTLGDIKEPAEAVLDPTRKMSKLCDFVELDEEAIEPTPCQLVRGSSLSKVHNLFLLLGLQNAYVTDRGRLIGVVSVNELREVVSDIYAGKAALKYIDPNFHGA